MKRRPRAAFCIGGSSLIWISGDSKAHTQRQLAAEDGTAMFVRHWANSTAKAVLVYLHGQGDHSGPFVAMGDLLADKGYTVYALDQRGFGQSPLPRGDVTSYDLFVADARYLLRQAAAEYPGKPVVLIGLSMGGHIALRTAAGLSERELMGVVALSPGFGLQRTPWGLIPKMAWHYLTQPRRYLPTYIRGETPTTRNAEHNQRAGEDPSWVQAYTARFYIATARSVRRARHEMRQVVVPVLILQGGEEFLVDPRKSQRYFAEIGSKDKEYRQLPGLYHNLVVEPEMPEVVGLLDEWISRRLPK